MPLQPVTIPVAAHGTRFSASGCFVSLSEDLASLTHTTDAAGHGCEHSSVWMAVPVGRRILLAAGMLAGTLAARDLPRSPVELVRDRALGDLLRAGMVAAQAEARQPRFENGYRGCPGEATRFELLGERLDEAFGFVHPPAT